MQLNGMHRGLLALLSLFTGAVAPNLLLSDGSSMSYLMTDFRVWIYFLLSALILDFYLIATSSGRMMRLLGYSILFILSLLAISTWRGLPSMLVGELEVIGFSWGWIFLLGGSILLASTLRTEEHTPESTPFITGMSMILGVTGSLTLAILSGAVILTSLSYSLVVDRGSILEKLSSTGELYTSSGGILSGSYPSEPILTYDRRREILTITTGTGVMIMTEIRTIEGVWQISGTGRVLSTGGELAWISGGHIQSLSGAIIPDRYAFETQEGGVGYQSGRTITLISPDGTRGSIELSSGTIFREAYHISDSGYPLLRLSTFTGDILMHGTQRVRGIPTDASVVVSRDGKRATLTYHSESGRVYETSEGQIIIERSSGDRSISNGSHLLSRRYTKSGILMMYDGYYRDDSYSEVREMFLDVRGSGYGFFGRKMEDNRYCLFTRDRGSLCGFSTYMNPIQSADGTSLIYFAKIDDTWGIYRNTTLLQTVKNYLSNSPTSDYIWYDATNPRTFLIVQKIDGAKAGYRYIKNGAILPGVYDDVGTNVFFGFDDHILTTVKIGAHWSIIEL